MKRGLLILHRFDFLPIGCFELGQTRKRLPESQKACRGTTDAVTGGLGSGKEHREVQEDIETADSQHLGAILNRDLIIPWMQLEFGPQKTYPRLVIARPKAEDLKAWTAAAVPWVKLGLEVDQAEVRDKLGLSAPKAGAPILGKSAATPPRRQIREVLGAKATRTPLRLPLNTHLIPASRNYRGMPLSRLKSPQG